MGWEEEVENDQIYQAIIASLIDHTGQEAATAP